MKLLLSTLTFLGFASHAQAYKIRKWNTITEKTPVTPESYHELKRFYELIYTLGWSSLNSASSNDAFDVLGKFGINLQSTGSSPGFQALEQFQTKVDSLGKQVNDDEEAREEFRHLVEVLEQEMLLMNAALAYTGGYMDKVDHEQAANLRAAREDFLFQGQAFERDQLWAARSWNRIWKKQGLPVKGYTILQAKF